MVWKSNFIYKIWLYNFDIVVLVNFHFTCWIKYYLIRFSWNVWLKIDDISLSKGTRLGLYCIWLIFACMRHDAMRFMLGYWFLIWRIAVVGKGWFAKVCSESRIWKLSSIIFEFFNILLSGLYLSFLLFVKLI